MVFFNDNKCGNFAIKRHKKLSVPKPLAHYTKVSDRVHTLRASGAFLQSENLSCHGDAETLAKTRAARGHHHASFSQHAIPLSKHTTPQCTFNVLCAFPGYMLFREKTS
jgi:hypothetical protein